jgi:hypothetical protein
VVEDGGRGEGDLGYKQSDPCPRLNALPLVAPYQIFVEYETKEDSQKAQAALSGRKFGNRYVVTSFLTEDKYNADDFTE